MVFLPVPALSRSDASDSKIRAPCMIRGVCAVGLPGKIRAPCMIQGVSAAKRAPPWQDMRAMHSRKAVCGAFRIHGAQILPKPARFGCMAAICCQGGALFPSGAPSGMHEAKNLPLLDVGERIASIYRRIADTYCRAWRSENESQSHLARKAALPAAKESRMLIFCHVSPEPIRGMRRCPAAAMRAAAMEESGRGVIGARGCRLRSGALVRAARRGGSGIGHFAFSGFNCQERLRVCAVSVGNHEPTSRSAKLCRIMG